MFRPFRRPQGPRPRLAIKRVLRQGGRFTCGICRKQYGTEAEGEQCLAKCLHGHLNPNGTVTSLPGKRYRCRFCRRVFDSRAQAQSCASSCRATLEERVADEQSVKSPAVRGAAAASRGAKAAPKTAPQTKPGTSAPEAQKPATAASEPTRVVIVAPPPEPAAPPPPKAPRLTNETDKFFRDGAKYVCRTCQKKFFTRGDVVVCFDAHEAA